MVAEIRAMVSFVDQLVALKLYSEKQGATRAKLSLRLKQLIMVC